MESNIHSNQPQDTNEPCELKWEIPSLLEFKSQDTAFGDAGCFEGSAATGECFGGSEGSGF